MLNDITNWESPKVQTKKSNSSERGGGYLRSKIQTWLLVFLKKTSKSYGGYKTREGSRARRERTLLGFSSIVEVRTEAEGFAVGR